MLTAGTLKILTTAVVGVTGILLAVIFVFGYLTLIQYAENPKNAVVEPGATDESARADTARAVNGVTEERLAALEAPLNPDTDREAIGTSTGLSFTEKQTLLEAPLETSDQSPSEVMPDEERLRLLEAPLETSYE